MKEKDEVILAREKITGLSNEQILNCTPLTEKLYVKEITGQELRMVAEMEENALNRGNTFLASGLVVFSSAINSAIEVLRESWEKKRKQVRTF